MSRASRVPYAVFDNMPEKTDKPEVLGAHLEEVCSRLWGIRQSLPVALATTLWRAALMRSLPR